MRGLVTGAAMLLMMGCDGWLPLEEAEALGPFPLDLRRPAMAVDRNEGTVFLYGGSTFQRPEAETWAYRDGLYAQIHTQGDEQARRGAPLAYDEANQVWYRYGGIGYTAEDGHWVSDGLWRRESEGDWQRVDPAGAVNPGLRAFADMVYDAAHARLVLIGGRCEPECDPRTTWIHTLGEGWESIPAN